MASFSPDSRCVTRVVASPNQEARKGGQRPELIILHYTGMAQADAALARLCDPASEVSSHYLVLEDGQVCQLVPEQQRAWHAGASAWESKTDINSCSIGIEIANPGHDLGYPDFPDRQIDSVIALCRDIMRRRQIAAARVLAHSDVAPARKRDPGEKFPWQRLAVAGVGLWIEPTEVVPGPELDPGNHSEIIAKLQAALKVFGYGIAITGRYDAATKDVVTAFQRHFRPARIDGIADYSSFETLKRLLAARAAAS